MRVLHVGCGGAKVPPWFADFAEVRLDINPAVCPDIVSGMTDMASVESESFEAVYTAHTLEHLRAHEVSAAISEMYRVLKPSGQLAVIVPDLQAVCARAASGDLTEVLYVSPSGPIAAIDVLFGHRAAVELGNEYMAHRTGFTASSLFAALDKAGFSEITISREREAFGLYATCRKA